MSVGTSAALIIGGISAAGALGGAAINAHAAGSAADKQAQAGENALQFQERQYADAQANQAPYLAAGKTSLGDIMQGFTNGTFGPGSIPNFQAPTADQARQTPGYQFISSEGNRGVNAAASAGGRSLSGGTLKALDRYNTGLADSTYGDTFSRALSTYQAQLAGQSQSYNQLANIAGLGQTATQSINNTGQATAQNVGNLMTGIGNAQAAGTIGQANAIGGGIAGATNGITQSILLQQLGLLNPTSSSTSFKPWIDPSGAPNYSPPMQGNGPMIPGTEAPG